MRRSSTSSTSNQFMGRHEQGGGSTYTGVNAGATVGHRGAYAAGAGASVV